MISQNQFAKMPVSLSCKVSNYNAPEFSDNNLLKRRQKEHKDATHGRSVVGLDELGYCEVSASRQKISGSL